MHGDTTPIWLLGLIAVLLWAAFMVVYFQGRVRNHIGLFFAMRRSIRRDRKATRDFVASRKDIHKHMQDTGKLALNDSRHRR